ncbi:MAG: hypothetical protein ACLRFF_03715 [Alphaproteobacteria bacterium]
MIKDNAVTVAFHRLTIQNSHNAVIPVDNTIKNIVITGLESLMVTNPEDKKTCFKNYHLYVNNIEKTADNVYCRISDSRDGYSEDIYIANSEKFFTTGVNDIRSKQFFMNLDFSNNGYILICNQYLGNSGCYMAIEKAVSKILNDAGYKLKSVAIVNKGELSEYFEKGGIKAFEVTHFEQQSDVADDNAFCKKSTVILSPATRSKTSFEKFYAKIKRVFHNDNNQMRDRHEIAAKLIQESGIKYAFIENDGLDGINLSEYRVKVMSNHGSFDLIKHDGTIATRYDISHCNKDDNGNPSFEDIKNKINDIKPRIKEIIEQ